MKILLINPPIRLGTPAYFQPFGMAVMAQVLLDAGHEVQIYDINATRHTDKEVAEKLPREKFDIVGTGGLITVYKYLNFLMPLLRKTYKDTPIVVGGGGITSAPETHMIHLRPDYGILGEGEYTMLELANGVDHKEVAGLVCYKDGNIVFNPPRPLEKDLDKFPLQAFDLLDMNKYAEAIRHNPWVERELGTLATRGCPMNCAFCYHIFGRSLRMRSVDNVLDELELLIDRYGIQSIMFLDELFTAKKAYIQEFCQKIMERKLGLGWSCYSRVDTVNEDLLKLMRWAGCFRIGFGIESGSQKILDEMNKGVTTEQALKAVALARANIRWLCTTFIYGMPGEDKESLKENVRWCAKADLNPAFFFLNPYPGTKVYEENIDKIIRKYGSKHEFFKALDDAGYSVVNLTEFSDDEYYENKYVMEREMWKRHVNIKGFELKKGVTSEYVKDGVIFCVHPRHMGE